MCVCDERGRKGGAEWGGVGQERLSSQQAFGINSQHNTCHSLTHSTVTMYIHLKSDSHEARPKISTGSGLAVCLIWLKASHTCFMVTSLTLYMDVDVWYILDASTQSLMPSGIWCVCVLVCLRSVCCVFGLVTKREKGTSGPCTQQALWRIEKWKLNT